MVRKMLVSANFVTVTDTAYVDTVAPTSTATGAVTTIHDAATTGCAPSPASVSERISNCCLCFRRHQRPHCDCRERRCRRLYCYCCHSHRLCLQCWVCARLFVYLAVRVFVYLCLWLCVVLCHSLSLCLSVIQSVYPLVSLHLRLSVC